MQRFPISSFISSEAIKLLQACHLFENIPLKPCDFTSLIYTMKEMFFSDPVPAV